MEGGSYNNTLVVYWKVRENGQPFQIDRYNYNIN
jgi:hypothetical protein